MRICKFLLVAALLAIMVQTASAVSILKVDVYGDTNTVQTGYDDTLFVDAAGTTDPSVTTMLGITVTLDGLWTGANQGAAVAPDIPPGFTEHGLLCDMAIPGVVGTGPRTMTISGLDPNTTYVTSLWAYDGADLMTFDLSANGVLVKDDYVSNTGDIAYPDIYHPSHSPDQNYQNRIDFEATSDGSGVVVLQYSDPLPQPQLAVDVWGEWNTAQPGFTDTIYCGFNGTLDPTVTTAAGITVTLNGTWGGRNRGDVAAPDVPPDFTEHGLLVDWGSSWDPSDGSALERTVTISGLEPDTTYDTSLWGYEHNNPQGWDVSANGVLVVDDFLWNSVPTHNDENRMDFQATSDGDGIVVLEYSDPTSGLVAGQYLPYKINALTMTDPLATPATGPSYRINGLQMSTPPIAGDTDNDGKVDEADAATLAANWLKATDAVWEEGDFNDDGSVDDIDATLLAANWYVGVPTSAVPEPSTICLVLSTLGMLLGATFFRRGSTS